MASEKSKFNLSKLVELLSKCRKDDGEIILEVYIEAFTELNKMFGLLGTIFGFIVSDVKEKIGILQHYQTCPNAANYATAKSLIEYEVANNITVIKGKPPSGSRTLLRLHRAMLFIIRFLAGAKTVESGQKLGGVARTAYDETLSNHHIWIVRKTVGVALHTLPTRDHLIEKMGEDNTEKALDLLGEAVHFSQAVYDAVQESYEQNDILNLP